MTYYILGMGVTDNDTHHVWSDENVVWKEPDNYTVDHGTPVGPAMCGAEPEVAFLDRMDDRFASLQDYLRHAEHNVCPWCTLALERRHGLPAAEYRTDTLDDRITEALAVADAAKVAERAQDLIDRAEDAGRPTTDLTLTVSPEVRAELDSHTVRVARDMDAAAPGGETAGAGGRLVTDMDFETVEIDIDVDPSLSGAIDTVAQREMDEPDVAVVMERLTNLTGVSTYVAQQLFEAGYYDRDDLQAASQSDLAELDGISGPLAARIKTDVTD